MIKTYLTLATLIISLMLLGCNDEKKIADSNYNLYDYEIIEIDDCSFKAIGNKLLSQYEKSELDNLPFNKKLIYRIVLSKNVKVNQILPIIESIIQKLTIEDSDIDEIGLFFYSNKEIINGVFDIASAVWAPYGELGNVDANIAKNNIRKDYKITYEIKENIESYLADVSKSESKFGLSEIERKRVFKEIVSVEDEFYRNEKIKHNQALDKILMRYGNVDGKNQDKLRLEYDKITLKYEEIMNKNLLNVFRKYKISQEEADIISSEATIKNWPLE